MKNLNLILIALVSLLLTACSGGGSVASGSSGGGGTTPIDDSAPSAYKVIGMNKSEVSTFGTNVTLTFNTAPQLITSVMAGAYDCMYTHIGTTLIVTIPEELPGPTIELMVRDEQGRQLQFEVDNELPVLPGIKVTTTVVPGFSYMNQGRVVAVDGQNNRILRARSGPSELYWNDMDDYTETASAYTVTNAAQYFVHGVMYQYESGTMYRYDENGVRDPNFQFTQSGGIAAYSDQHIYVPYIHPNPGQISTIHRFNISDGSLDTTFADNGVLNLQETLTWMGMNYQLAVSDIKLKLYDGKIYIQLLGQWHRDGTTPSGGFGPILKILNETDGSAVSTPEYFRTSMLELQQDDNQQSFLIANSGNPNFAPKIRVDQDGIYLFGGSKSIQRIRHSDLMIDDTFYIRTDENELAATTDWRDVNYKVDWHLRARTAGLNVLSFPVNSASAVNHPNIGWTPFILRSNLVDIVPLESGNLLLIQIERDQNSPAYNQICGYVIQKNGVPIRGHRNQKSCAHMTFDVEGTSEIPMAYVAPTVTGEDYYKSGNRHTFFIQTGIGNADGKLYRVDFDIVE